MNRTLLIGGILLLAAAAARGDVIELTDGRVIEGLVKSESPAGVVFEAHLYGATSEMQIPRSTIKKLTLKELAKPATPAPTTPKTEPVKPPTTRPGAKSVDPNAPKYFLVPLAGVVGREIVADKLKDAFAVGLKDPTVVLVLEVNSPGGLLSECEKVLRLLSEYRDRRSIAFIHCALSAGAIISLACDEIYMDGSASIGAATAIHETEAGWSAAGEKVQSVWRSMCRNAADVGGHNPLLAEAMVDSNMNLRIVRKNGKPDVEQFLRATEKDVSSGDIVVASGKLLTLTAKEAVRCGLAAGVADTLDQVAEQAKLSGWRPVGGEALRALAAQKEGAKDIEEKLRKCQDLAEKAWIAASASNPANGGSYEIDSNGRLVGASRQTYIQGIKRCFAFLGECDGQLGRIEAMCKLYPIYEPRGEWARQMRNRVLGLRAGIEAQARTLGVN